MHSRAVSLSCEPYVLGAVHRGRSGTRRRFRRGVLNVGLCRGCLVGISVFVMGVCCRYPVDQERYHGR